MTHNCDILFDMDIGPPGVIGWFKSRERAVHLAAIYNPTEKIK